MKKAGENEGRQKGPKPPADKNADDPLVAQSEAPVVLGNS